MVLRLGLCIRKFFLVMILFCGFLMTACVSFPPDPKKLGPPQFLEGAIVARDHYKLHTSLWKAADAKAVVVVVHGMNDYGFAFEQAARSWSGDHNLTVVAYDQRGFGRNIDPGIWPGSAALKTDFTDVLEATKREFPDLPLFVVAHSMGAAVAMIGAAETTLPLEGMVLAAPTVWRAGEMPVAYRLSANLAAMVAPQKVLTGERAQRQVTDNI